MKIGVSFDGFSPFEDALVLAHEAVHAGVSSLWMADHLVMLRNRYLDENVASSGVRIDQDAIIAAMASRDFARAQDLISDETVDAFTVAGTVRECCDKLQKYLDAGLKEPALLMAGTLEDQRFGLNVVREIAGH